MKAYAILVFLFFTQACISPRMDVGYVNWDSDGDHHLDNYEFLTGFRKSHYFLTWHRSGHKLNVKQFYTSIFSKLDENNDAILTDKEFNSRIDYYYFMKQTQNFRQWDANDNKEVTREEFNRSVAKSELLSMWDTSADKAVSEREIAHGMFYLCDLNKDGSIDPLEFNIWNINR